MATDSTTAISRRRRPHGRYPKTQEGATPKRQKRIPEYLEPDEVNAIIRAAPNPKAKLLMLEQWRGGLRVSEALDLEVRDLSLDTPVLRSEYAQAKAANHGWCQYTRSCTGRWAAPWLTETSVRAESSRCIRRLPGVGCRLR